MKKILAAVLTFGAITSLCVYVYAKSADEADSDLKTQLEYEVPFENPKLIDTKIDKETGVQIDVYTIENWKE